MIRILINSKDLNEKAEMLLDFLERKSIQYDSQSYLPLKSPGRKLTQVNRSIKISALMFGILGFVSSMLFQYWSQTVYYRQNIGNREFFSWVTSLPIAFEIAVLSAALAAFIAFIIAVKSDKSKSFDIGNDDFCLFISQNDIDDVIEFLQSNKIEFNMFENDSKD